MIYFDWLTDRLVGSNTSYRMKQFLRLFLSGFGLLFSVTNSLYEGLTTRSSDIRTTHNARLCGYVISKQRTVNIFDCAHRCLSDRRCASFNFRGKLPGRSGDCELNGVESLRNNAKPKQTNGWIHGFMQGKNWHVPNGRFI
jgi:hypothetical protein